MSASLRIEWRRLEAVETPLLCSETGRTIYEIAADLKRELSAAGVEVTFVETRLRAEQFNQSNMILLNGVALEKINLDPGDPAPYCGGCADPTDEDRYVTLADRGGELRPQIPGSIIRLAALKTLGMRE